MSSIWERFSVFTLSRFSIAVIVPSLRVEHNWRPGDLPGFFTRMFRRG
jgi:hypothetical protein